MAKVRYMIDYVFDDARLARGENPYVPAGVWAMSETQFEVAYLPGFEARAEEVDAWLTGLVEEGIDPVKVEGFLEHWRDRRPSQNGSFAETTAAERLVPATAIATLSSSFEASNSPA